MLRDKFDVIVLGGFSRRPADNLWLLTPAQ